MKPVRNFQISDDESMAVYSGPCQEKLEMMSRAERRAFLKERGALSKTKRVKLRRKGADHD